MEAGEREGPGVLDLARTMMVAAKADQRNAAPSSGNDYILFVYPRMLLILSASSFRALLIGRRPKLDLLSLPHTVRNELGLHGLAVPTEFLKGWSPAAFEQLRRNADKSGCPILMIYEPATLPLSDDRKAEEALDRMSRVVQAAERLGCSAAGFSIQAPDNDRAFDSVVARLKHMMGTVDRLGVNLLLRPHGGLMQMPDRVAEVIKHVGGFRIGALPDFEAASQSDDAMLYLRRLAPYAPVLFGSTVEFDKKGRHTSYDLGVCMRALAEIGYNATIAVDYRGAGDPAAGILQTRDAILSLLAENAG